MFPLFLCFVTDSIELDKMRDVIKFVLAFSFISTEGHVSIQAVCGFAGNVIN